MAHPRTQQWRAPSSTLTPTPFHTYAYFKPQFLTFFGADAREISRYCLPARVSQVVARPAHHAADLGSCSGCAKTPAAAATLCRFAQCRQPIFLFQQQIGDATGDTGACTKHGCISSRPRQSARETLAATRQTTLAEKIAYSLLSILHVVIPIVCTTISAYLSISRSTTNSRRQTSTARRDGRNGPHGGETVLFHNNPGRKATNGVTMV
ncbi:hypothetical protein HD554DRAFT_1782986 [Boletus coccyginus]|nr:hypothetical protein HD554DRAFT_1782986 [Boletus coccyginus]